MMIWQILKNGQQPHKTTFQGESPSEKQSLSEPSSALQNIASSSAWLFPAGGVATALLFRTQIEGMIDEMFSKIWFLNMIYLQLL